MDMANLICHQSRLLLLCTFVEWWSTPTSFFTSPSRAAITTSNFISTYFELVHNHISFYLYISYEFINVEAFKFYLRIGRSCTNEFDLLVITSTLESKLVVLDIVDEDIFLAIPRSAAMLIVLLEDVSNDTLVREYSKIIFKDIFTHVSSLSLLLFVSTATFSSMLNNGVLMLSIMVCL